MNTKTFLPISSRLHRDRATTMGRSSAWPTTCLSALWSLHAASMTRWTVNPKTCRGKSGANKIQNGAALHGGTFVPTRPSAYSLSKGDKLQHRLHESAVCNRHFAKGRISAVSSSLRQCARPSLWMVRLGRPPKANSDVTEAYNEASSCRSIVAAKDPLANMWSMSPHTYRLALRGS
eukprot:5491485-Amphidinium_carterae.1